MWDIQRLFRVHSREILRSLRRRGLDPDTAADLLQDTFLRVLSKPPSNSAQNFNPRAYLFEVSRTLSINYKKRSSNAPIVAVDDELLAQIADQAPSPETVVYSRQCLEQVARALDELPETTRMAFELHRFEGLTIGDVATQIGLSTTRTWELIHHAYRHLLERVDFS